MIDYLKTHNLIMELKDLVVQLENSTTRVELFSTMEDIDVVHKDLWRQLNWDETHRSLPD